MPSLDQIPNEVRLGIPARLSPPGYALLTFPGSSHAVYTNPLFLPVFQALSQNVLPVVGLQYYSHYEYTT